MQVEKRESEPFCPPVIQVPKEKFKRGRCCLFIPGEDGPRFCGEIAPYVRAQVGFRTHDGGLCYRCEPHAQEEMARGIKFGTVNTQ